MKTIIHTSKSKDKMLHIETELGIVNITVGRCCVTHGRVHMDF